MECKTRHESPISILDYPFIRTRNISLTLPRSRSGSIVNNRNVADGQTGDKPKWTPDPRRLTLPRSPSGSVVDSVAARMLGLERKLMRAQARW